MNLGESAEETAIREIKEETGFDVVVKNLIGIYTKFFETHANGDMSQTVVVVFRLELVGGSRSVDNVETFDIQFFALEEFPSLYSHLHRVILDDLRSGKTGIFR